MTLTALQHTTPLPPTQPLTGSQMTELTVLPHCNNSTLTTLYSSSGAQSKTQCVPMCCPQAAAGVDAGCHSHALLPLCFLGWGLGSGLPVEGWVRLAERPTAAEAAACNSTANDAAQAWCTALHQLFANRAFNMLDLYLHIPSVTVRPRQSHLTVKRSTCVLVQDAFLGLEALAVRAQAMFPLESQGRHRTDAVLCLVLRTRAAVHVSHHKPKKDLARNSWQ